MKRAINQTISVRATALLLACGLTTSAVPVTAQHEGHDDDHVRLSASEIQEFDIILAVAGPDTVRLVRKLPAEVRVNENRLAHIVPRYAGIATEVRVDVGDAVREGEVGEVLSSPGEDRPGKEGSRVAIGQTRSGRFLRVIYIPDPVPDSCFVITAYELVGKPLLAYRRRRRRKGKR